MLGGDRYAKIVKKADVLNNQAVQAEADGDYYKAIELIDEAADLIYGVKPYRLLSWIINYNCTTYHYLYDQGFDKRKGIDQYFALRAIAKNNMSSEFYTEIKEAYAGLLSNILVLLVDNCRLEAEFDIILEELFALSRDSSFDKSRREKLYILASGMAAAKHIKTGNYALAIRFGTNILQLIEFDSLIDEQKLFYLNQLMFSYMGAGQTDRVVDLGRFLYVKFLSNELQTRDMEEVHRLILGYVDALASQGQHRLAVRIMNKSFEKGVAEDTDKGTYLLNLFIEYIELSNRCKTPISDEIYNKTKILLDKRRKKIDFRSIYVSEIASLDLYDYLLAKLRGEPYQRYLDNVYQVYAEKGCSESEFPFYSVHMRLLIKEYGNMGLESKVKNCARHMIVQLYKNIQYAQYYIDNDRMLQAINTANMTFAIAYSALIGKVTKEQRFEYLLNYKNILPTIVRQRDSQLELNDDLCNVLNEVNAVKDLIAEKSSSTQSLLKNTEKIALLRSRLNELENLFSEKYGKKQKIPHYSLDDFKKVLPEKSVVIDIFFSKSNLYLQEVEDILASYEFDLVESYIWVKQSECHFFYHANKEARMVVDLLVDFLETIQDPYRKYKKKANRLYDCLFGSTIDNIEGIEKIYICPHFTDANVPFELLFEENPNLAGCRIIHLQTIRELFFAVTPSQLSEMCIIGNPSYSLDNEYTEEVISGKRGTHLIPLPFSEYEARSIAKIYDRQCFIGKMAMKSRIRPGYRMFHIATHGFLERDGMENAWYSSSLSFAGIVDCLDTGMERNLYGNGILTADEISRMNLNETEMVVLSACNSGSSLFTISNQSVGLHIAFAAAGVQYVVSSLWNVDDLATALLMQIFSEECILGETVEASLYLAKQKLRRLTVAEICECINQSEGSECIPSNIKEQLKERKADEILFKHPFYWAGFICYQNKFENIIL